MTDIAHPFADLVGRSLPERRAALDKKVAASARKAEVPDPDAGTAFAAAMEDVQARLHGRAPRALISGPRQEVHVVTAAELIAAYRGRASVQAMR